MGIPFSKWRRLGWPGAGVFVAVLLLLGAEAFLHSDSFMHRLRAVFAVGRGFDKVLYVEREVPRLLVLGNSRIDNGVDPRTLTEVMDPDLRAFNLGLPGAGASALLGIAERLNEKSLLGPGRIERVLIGLDEGLLQAGDALGYEVFFVEPSLSEDGPRDFVRASVRLWGYAENLKQLREPAKLIDFVRAMHEPVEPVGGGAAERQGYRPGFGAHQDAGQVARQEAGSTAPPSAAVVADFLALLDLLSARKVEVAVVFPPLMNRKVLYLESQHPAAGPYLAVVRELARRNVPMFAPGHDYRISPSEFINAGHLNDSGAQRFSRALGRALVGMQSGEVQRVSMQ